MVTIPPYDDYRLAHTLAIIKSASLVGFAIGGFRGGRRAALQFMAETQHAVAGIRTRQEAAAYWKLRHARTIVGATKEGIVRALQLTSVAAVFVTVRHLVDHVIEGETGVCRASTVQSDTPHGRKGSPVAGPLPNMAIAFIPYMGQVAAAMASGSLFALVAPSSQRLRYGLRGASMGGAMAISLALLQLSLMWWWGGEAV